MSYEMSLAQNAVLARFFHTPLSDIEKRTWLERDILQRLMEFMTRDAQG